MSERLQFLDDRIHPARTDEQDPLRQPADDFLGELFPRQQLFREDDIFGLFDIRSRPKKASHEPVVTIPFSQAARAA